MSLNGRLRDLIVKMRGGSFGADALTGNGSLTVAGNHDPNGSQNAIGAAIRTWHAQGLIEPTGTYVRSKAPHRKGGANQEWRATPRGEAWAAGTDRLL